MIESNQRAKDLAMVQKHVDRFCKICGVSLPQSHHGLRCRACTSVANKRIYRDNPSIRAAIRARMKAYTTKNRARVYAKTRARTIIVSKDKPLMMAFYQARSRSKRRGIPFAISFSDIPPPPEFCPVLGMKLIYNSGKRTDSSPSLDKIVPVLGYVPGNIAVISFRANCIKRDSTSDELRKIADYMDGHTGQ